MRCAKAQDLPPKIQISPSLQTLLVRAHKSLKHFKAASKHVPVSQLRTRELDAQSSGEKTRYRRLLSFSARAVRKRKLTSALLKEMHRILKPEQKGLFRKKQNWIGPKGCKREEAYFLPPPQREVPRDMRHLQAYADRTDQDPLLQLAIYFAQLLIIHPFMDANGRLARSLIPLFLYRSKLIDSPRFYLSAYFRLHRSEYFERLYLISEKEDWEGWIRFFLQGIIQEGQKAIRGLRKA